MNEYQTLTESAPVVLVEFFATWCPHCRHMMPIVADVKERVVGIAEIYQLDIDKNSELADAVGVSGVPTSFTKADARCGVSRVKLLRMSYCRALNADLKNK